MILSDVDILRWMKSEALVIRPFNEDRLQPASYDFLLCDEFRVFDTQVTHIDPRARQSLTKPVKVVDRAFVLHPGEFVLGGTVETVKIPNGLTGRLEGKSGLGRLGLQVHSTAGFFDPGFDGVPTLELSNVSRLPILLWPGMPICHMSFVVASSRSKRPYGTPGLGSKYTGPTADRPTESLYHQNFVEEKA